MSRRFINQLGHQEAVDQVFLASQKQLRPNRNGNLFLQVELSDRSGTVSARMWNADEADYNSFEDGDFVRVVGSAQNYQGTMQIIATRVSRARDEEIDAGDFMPLAPAQIDELAIQLGELVRGLKDPHLRAIGECFLIDEAFMDKLSRAPAGVKNHHAYVGGLLEHVVNLMDVARRIADCYPALDADLLLAGCFLHDMGKVDELSYDRGFSYTDEGQLIGHVVMAVSMLEQKVREAEKLTGEPIPAELVLRLKHMIVSHHGQYEYGSPKLPMTVEAVALAQLDNLDAKIHNFAQTIREDANVDSAWTTYLPALGRKLYKGSKSPKRDNPLL